MQTLTVEIDDPMFVRYCELRDLGRGEAQRGETPEQAIVRLYVSEDTPEGDAMSKGERDDVFELMFALLGGIRG